MKELSKGQLTRVVQRAVNLKKAGYDKRNILRHLQQQLGRFKVDWTVAWKALN